MDVSPAKLSCWLINQLGKPQFVLCIARDGEILRSCKGDTNRTQVPCGSPCCFFIHVVDLARAWLTWLELEECHSEPKYGANGNPSLEVVQEEGCRDNDWGIIVTDFQT